VHSKFLDASGKRVGRDKARGRSRHLEAGTAPLIPAYQAGGSLANASPLLLRRLRPHFVRRELTLEELAAFHNHVKIRAVLQDRDVFRRVAIDHQ